MNRQVNMSVIGLIYTCSKLFYLYIDVGLNTSVTVSQLNIWKGFKTVASLQKCSSTTVGDILQWQALDDADLNNAYLQIPSQCDGNDKLSRIYRKVIIKNSRQLLLFIKSPKNLQKL